MLICGDVIRPGLPWMLTRTHRYLASVMAHTRDPDGFARLRQLADADPASSAWTRQIAATRIATLLACKGGRIADITVGDCVELVDTLRRVHARGGQKKVDFYLRLRALGIFPARCAAHHPRLRARRRAADASRNWSTATGCAARRSATCSSTTCGSGSRRWTSPASTRSPAPWPGCSGPRSKPSRRASTPCGSHRTIVRTWKEDLATKKRTITNAGRRADRGRQSRD